MTDAACAVPLGRATGQKTHLSRYWLAMSAPAAKSGALLPIGSDVRDILLVVFRHWTKREDVMQKKRQSSRALTARTQGRNRCRSSRALARAMAGDARARAQID